MTTRYRIPARTMALAAVLISIAAASVNPATSSFVARAATAQDHGSGGGHDSGGHDSGGGKGGSKGHKGPDPNCAFQDRTGRGGFGPQARRGQSGGGGGHSGGDSHATEGDHKGGGVHTGSVATDTGSGIVGGGAGGEGYVCDGPGDWSVDGKVLDR